MQTHGGRGRGHFHPRSPPPGPGHGIPPGFGMMAPGMMPPPMAPAIPLGPLHPVIFAGHLGLGDSDQDVVRMEMAATEEGNPSSEEDQSGNKRYQHVFEINLNHQAHFLEGIHVVPLGITPPVGFDFKGRTLPELATGAFTLEIFARDLDAAFVKKVLAITVFGGVQWHAIPHPFNSIAIDYIAVKGNFDMLSLIIHGGTIASSDLRPSALKLLESGLPIPPGFVSADVEASDDAEYDSDEDGQVGTIQAGGQHSQIGGDRMVQQPQHPPLNIIEAVNFPVNFFNEKLKRRATDLSPCLELLGGHVGGMASPYCRVTIESIAELVEYAFSVDLKSLSAANGEPLAKYVILLDSLREKNSCCLQSSIDDVKKSIDEKDSDGEKRDEFAAALGEDVAQHIAYIIIKFLTIFDASSPFHFNITSANDFLHLGSTVLRCFKAMVHNEFTAKALLNLGGLTQLCYIIRQKASLPPTLLMEAFEILTIAVKYDSVASEISELGYQSLLICLSSMQSYSCAARPCRIALNWFALVGSCQALNAFSKRTSSILENAAQSVTTYVSLLSSGASTTTSSASADHMDIDSVGASAPKLAAAAASEKMAHFNHALQASFYECKKLIIVWQASLCAVVGRAKKVGEADEEEKDHTINLDSIAAESTTASGVIRVLHGTNVMASLATVAALALALEEQAVLADWYCSSSEEGKGGYALGQLSSSCYGLLTGAFGVLFELVQGTELIIGARSVEAHLMWQMLAQEDHVLAAQPVEELIDATFLASGGDIETTCHNFSTGSLGWLLMLSTYAAGISQRIYTASNDPEAAVYDLHELSGFPCGASVAARCVAQFCLDKFVYLFESLSTTEGLIVRCLELLLCCLTSESSFVMKKIVANSGRLFECINGLLGRNHHHHAVSVRVSTVASQVKALLGMLGQGDAIVWKKEIAVCSVQGELQLFSDANVMSNLSTLEAAMRFLPNLESEAAFYHSTLQNDDARKLFGGALAVLRSATKQSRGGGGWSLESSASTDGYDDAFFSDFQSPPTCLSLAEHNSINSDNENNTVMSSEAKTDRIKIRIQLAHSLVRTILSSLQLMHRMLLSLNIHANSQLSTNKSFKSEELFVALLEANAFARCLLNCRKSGHNGVYARRIVSTINQIFRMYCPPSPWSDDCCLVAYLVGTALHIPRFLQSNIALLRDILPSFPTGMQLEAKVFEQASSGFAPFGTSLNTMAQQYCRLAQALALRQEELNSTSAKSHTDHRGEMIEAQCEMWQTFLSRPPLFTSVGVRRSQVTPFTFLSTDLQTKTNFPTSPITIDPLLDVTQALFEGRLDLVSLVLCGLQSTSLELHFELHGLCIRAMALNSCIASSLAKGLVETLTNAVLLHLHGNVHSMRAAAEAGNVGNKGLAETKTDYEIISGLSRLLAFVHDICLHDSPCIILIEGGMLLPLFASLHSSSSQVANLALQAITSVYRVLNRAVTRLGYALDKRQQKSSLEEEDESLASCIRSNAIELQDKLRVTIQAIAEGMLSLLPAMLARFQASALVTAQAVLTIVVLPPRYLKGLLDALAAPGSLIQVEAISVKLWLFFEDTFQTFISLVEALKDLTATDALEFFGSDNGVEMVTAAHSQLAAASSALSGITEIVVSSYAKGWVPLATMNRSLRSAVADPRKVALRYQRTYTMWSTERRRAYVPEGIASAGIEEAQEFPLPPLHCSTRLERLDFDARHALVASALRGLVESTRRHHEYVKGGLTREDVKSGDLTFSHSASSQVYVGLDILQPFGQDEASIPLGDAWYAIFDFDERASDCLAQPQYTQDAMHSILRRSYILGSELVSSAFDNSEAYLRLKLLPKLADPGADKRRRDRRVKRRAERATANKAAAEAAAEAARVVAQEAEAKRVQLEEEAHRRKMEAAAEAQAAAPHIVLAGVPRQLLSKFSSQMAPARSSINVSAGNSNIPPVASTQGPTAPPPPRPPAFHHGPPPPPPPPPPPHSLGLSNLPPPPRPGGLPPPKMDAAPAPSAGRGRAATLPAWMTNQNK